MEILPEALSVFDARKRAAIAQIADLLRHPSDVIAQQFSQAVENPKERGRLSIEALSSGRPAEATAAAMQMAGPDVGLAKNPGNLLTWARSQLAQYQRAPFEMILQANGGDPVKALAQTRQMTNLMSGGQ